MSYKQLSPAWEANLPCPSKLVLISLADQANDDGVCWPSIATLTRRTGLDERSIFRHLATLEKLGHLHREQRPGRSNVYHVHPISTPDNTVTTTTPDKSVTPDYVSPPPLTESHPTPDRESPITVIEPKCEPTLPSLSTLQAKVDPATRAAARLNGKRQAIDEVMAYMNLQARRNYRVVNPNGTYTAHADVIYRRLKEGYTPRQLKDVIGHKSGQWMGDEKMDQYLNPTTLFRKTNFVRYLAESEAE